MKNTFFLFCCLLLSHTIFSQTFLSGVILDDKNHPLQGVSVRVYEPNSKSLQTFAISNTKGSYRLNKPFQQDSVRLVVSLMGYKTQERIVDKNHLNQDFTLTPQAIELKEVIVKNPPLTQRHDTLSYDIKKFANSADRNLGDVLKKLPGVEVEQNGTVKYNGEAINKYYTQGKDLFEGKYKIANDNFRWQDVERVEVLENHQPIKLLTDIKPSTQAGLNVVFKESVKAKWIRKLEGGLGKNTDNFLYDNTLNIIRIGASTQSFSILKSNNVGTDLSASTASLTIEQLLDGGGSSYSVLQKNNRSLSSILGLNQPALDKRFFLFNQSHYLTSKNLWTLRKIYDTVLNVEFLKDKQQNEGFNENRYFLGKDTLNIREQQANHLSINQLEATLSVVANQPKYYFSNKFLFKTSWQYAEGSILNNSRNETQTIVQQNQFDTQWVSNELKMLKKNAHNHILELRAWGYYLNSPQTLNAINEKQQITSQDIRLQKSFAQAYTNFILNKKVKLNVKAGIEYANQQFKSSLMGFPASKLVSDSSLLSTNQSLSYTRAFAETGYGIASERFKLNLSLPLSFLYWQELNKSHFYGEPKVMMSYLFSSKWSSNVNYSYNYTIAEINEFSQAFILSNYRNIERNNAQLPENQRHAANWSLNFKDVVSFWFFNTRVGINEFQSNLVSVQQNDGIYLSQTKMASVNGNQSLTLSSDLSKYIYEIKTKFTLSAFKQSQQSVRLLSDNQLANIQNGFYGLSFGVNSKFLKWLQTSLDIKTVRSQNKIRTDKLDTFTEAKKIELTFQNDFIISNRLTFGIEATNYLIENPNNRSQNYWFLDGSSTYHFKKKDIEISLYARNLTNEKSFQTISFMDNSSAITNFHLRPQQILLKCGFKF